MDKLSPDFIWYLFLFLIPGFCMTIWLKLFVPMRPENENRDMITCILLSLFLALPWLLYQGWLGNLSYFHCFRDLAFLVAFMLLAPLLGAVILSKIVHNPGRYPWKIFEAWLGVRPVHPIASAWDKSFMSLRKGWVLVTLKDGTQIGGILSGHGGSVKTATAFPGAGGAKGWLTRPSAHPTFDGMRPLHRMLKGGMDDLLAVLQVARAAETPWS